MILSIHDFSGPVEFLNNRVNHNTVFIPAAILSNVQKFNSSVLKPFIAEFERSPDVLQFELNQTGALGHMLHFLTYFDPSSQSERLKEYQSISPIFIKNVNASHIVFENNTFDSNIGLTGGAIHLDLRAAESASSASHVNWFSPFVYLKNNTFTRNMAYFEGNAVVIRGGQRISADRDLISKQGYMQVLVDGCLFK